MVKRKKVILFFVLAIPLLILAGCGTSKVDSTTGSEGSNKSISTKLNFSADGEGTFIIKNDSNEEIILTSTSGQQIEFQLLNEAKETMYTYSANKMFMQGIVEKKLQAGEEWKIPLNLHEELAEVPNGSYTLVVWSTTGELNNRKIETVYEWTGNTTTDSTGKLVVETQEVTYIGQQDLHSIEVKNLDGATEVMRLSEVATPFFEELKTGTQLFVEYVVENGQKVIQTARTAG